MHSLTTNNRISNPPFISINILWVTCMEKIPCEERCSPIVKEKNGVGEGRLALHLRDILKEDQFEERLTNKVRI